MRMLLNRFTAIQMGSEIMLHRENKIRTYHLTSAADLIRGMLANKYLTQTDLARQINVSPAYVADILSHRQYLTAELANRIENILGISSSLLLALDRNYQI